MRRRSAHPVMCCMRTRYSALLLAARAASPAHHWRWSRPERNPIGHLHSAGALDWLRAARASLEAPPCGAHHGVRRGLWACDGAEAVKAVCASDCCRRGLRLGGPAAALGGKKSPALTRSHVAPCEDCTEDTCSHTHRGHRQGTHPAGTTNLALPCIHQ